MGKEKRRHFVSMLEEFKSKAALDKRASDLVSKCIKSNSTNCTICSRKYTQHKMRVQYSMCKHRNCPNKNNQCYKILNCKTHSKYRIISSIHHDNNFHEMMSSNNLSETKIERNSSFDVWDHSVSNEAITLEMGLSDSTLSGDVFYNEIPKLEAENQEDMSDKTTQTDDLLELTYLTNIPIVDLDEYFSDSYNRNRSSDFFYNHMEYVETFKNDENLFDSNHFQDKLFIKSN